MWRYRFGVRRTLDRTLMPHVIIEYSDNIEAVCDIDSVVDSVHRAATSSPIIPIAGLRTRAVARSNYRIADGGSGYAFVSVIVRLGPGRSDDQKLELVNLLMDALSKELETSPLSIAFSVECQQIEAATRRNKNQIRTAMEQGPTD